MLDLYKSGSLKLDDLVTRTYDIKQINESYGDMHAGLSIRGVISSADRHR